MSGRSAIGSWSVAQWQNEGVKSFPSLPLPYSVLTLYLGHRMAEAGADLKSKMTVSLRKGVTVSSWGIFLGDKKLVPGSPSRLSLTCLWLELGLNLIAELIPGKEDGWTLPEAPGYTGRSQYLREIEVPFGRRWLLGRLLIMAFKETLTESCPSQFLYVEALTVFRNRVFRK